MTSEVKIETIQRRYCRTGATESRRKRTIWKPRLLMFSLFFTVGAWIAASALASDQVVNKVPNAFDPRSVPAYAIRDLSMLVLAICAGIFLVVTAALVFVVLRYRSRPTDNNQEPTQIYGSSQIELAWTVIPILITIVLILVTARTIGDIQDKELPKDALVVKIVGHQWWWEVRYPQYGFVTANEIHVPVSSPSRRAPVRIVLESADVLHSFWVPQLAGKTQLVPNKTNITWIEPLHTGVYLGNCAQYCGTQHAFMLLRVVVHTPEDFQRWVANQKKPAESLASIAVASSEGTSSGTAHQAALAAEGQKVFQSVACVNCHRIDGTSARGVFGPDLTHLMSRQTIGAGVAENTHQNLWQWVRNPQVLKIGCLMPDMQLTHSQVDEIVAYLETLR